MITIEDLLSMGPELRGFGAQPEMDPLTEEGALQEAQLLDVRFDALRATVGLLFEFRVALQLRTANTSGLIARCVRELSWRQHTSVGSAGSVEHPEDSLSPGGMAGWATTRGPNSFWARGGLALPEMPPALNIEWLLTKP